MNQVVSVRLEGSRILLRDLEEADLEAMHDLRSDPQICRNMDWELAADEEPTRLWLAETIRHNRRNPRFGYNLAIVLRDTRQVIGWIGIGAPSHPTCAGELDFGYALQQAYWGRGYMTEALRLLLDLAFRMLGASRVFGECHLDNPASARVMEKAGMLFEGLHESPGADGVARMQRRYAISAPRWRSRSEEDES
jgi:[ribosomal protein S5]-alanine N-acetyltransferase